MQISKASRIMTDNKILNGGFNVYQNGSYLRGFRIQINTTVTHSIDVPADSDSEYSVRIVPGSLTNYNIRAIIENAKIDFFGNWVTVELKAKADAARTIAIDLSDGNNIAINLDTEWRKYRFSFISNGTASQPDGFLDIENRYGSLTPYNVTDIKVGLGANVEFKKRTAVEELALRQRYYNVIGKEAHGTWKSGSTVGLGWSYPVEMRAAPTITLATTTPVIGRLDNPDNTGFGSTILTSKSGVKGGSAFINGMSSGAFNGNGANSETDVLFTASAEL